MSGERNDEVTGRDTNFHHRNPSEEGRKYSSTFVFLIPSVIGLLQAKDLFQSYPFNMWISVAALLIFCLSLASIKEINPTEHETKYSQIIYSFCFLSGALVTVALLSIFLPHQFRWLFFLIWALLAAYIVSRYFFKLKDTWIYTLVLSAGVLMKKAILSVWNHISNRFTEPITVQGDHVLPI